MKHSLDYRLGLVLILLSSFLMTACATKTTPSNYSQYGDGETTDGGIGLGTLKRVHFGFDDSEISGESKQRLDANIQRMKSETDMEVLIEDQTDERGSVEYNIALGERRAGAVKDYLTTSGIEHDRVQTKSWGEEKPLATGRSSEDYRLNRRAEFIITDN